MNTLEDRVKQLAIQVASDYPGVENLSVDEALWAITSTLAGTRAANEEWSQWYENVKAKYGMTADEALDLWPKSQPKLIQF